MYGRTRLTASPDAIAAAFGLGEVTNLEQLGNIAPSEMIATIRTPGELEQMRSVWTVSVFALRRNELPFGLSARLGKLDPKADRHKADG